MSVPDAPTVDAERARRPLGDAFALCRDADGRQRTECAECGFDFGDATRDPKLAAVVRERSIADLSAHNHHGLVDEMVAREFYCPGCSLLLTVNVQRRGAPIMVETTLDPTAAA